MPSIRHDREFWKRASEEVDRGAKTKDVARRLGVRARTLTWWRWKLGQERRAARADFLPVVFAEPMPVCASPKTVELKSKGVRMRFEVGTEVQYVAALVKALRDSC